MSEFLRGDTDNKADDHPGDGGFTLPELLITLFLTVTLVAVLTTALLVMLKATPQAEDRLAESKDVTFLTAWMPIDLSTSVASWDSPDDAVVKSEMRAGEYAITYDAALAGTNVLTLIVPDGDGDGGGLRVISYRYEQEADGTWRIARYRITNPGEATEVVSLVGVAYELAEPPEDWSPGERPTHAIEVVARNQSANQPVGEDVTVRFESGNEFVTGGASLSAEEDLLPQDPLTLPDPTAPPTRCGGDIALLLDTSGSVPMRGGGRQLQDAAISFIDGFVGTPTRISLNGFDRRGYAMITDPSASGIDRWIRLDDRADYVSVLDATAPGVQAMKDRINILDDRDNRWSGSWPRDDNGDGAHWDQLSQVYWDNPVTNWDDALYNTFFDPTGQPHNSFIPDLTVLLTDGDPYGYRSNSGGIINGGYQRSTNAAQATANEGRALGSRIIGVLVGGGQTRYLTQVVGTNRWDGSVDPNTNELIDAGNAVAADYFEGSWSAIGEVLRAIMVADCGGTITIRKELTDGSDPTGQWSYSSPTGGQVLDTDSQSSITFDFSFDDNSIAQTIRITEEVRTGYSFVDAVCSAGGEPLDASLVVQRPEGVAGVDVTVAPDQAVSCVMRSEPTP